MDGHSTAALTTLCSAIAQRAISSANEAQSLFEALDSSDHDISQLSSLAGALEELNQRASKLDVSLISSTISIDLHGAFKQYLTECDGTMTVLYKQLLRLQPDNIGSLNVEFVAAYCQVVGANSKLLESINDIVTMQDKSMQAASLVLLRSGDVAEQAERASKASKAQKSIVLDPGEASNASGSGSSSNPAAAQQESESAGPPPYTIELESSSSSDTQPANWSWGASLRNSFKALALSLVPQPGPFVSALCQAATIGDIQQIAGFLTQGANINGRNENSKNALQCAILADQEDAARLLLASGASTSGSGWSGMPPLFLAASEGSLNVAKMFIDKGASIDEKSTSGQSYFVDVVSSGNLDGIRFLLEQGCSANTKNISGEVVIANAARKNNMALMELLFEFGASVKSTDISGRTLLSVALDKKYYEMAEMLLQKGAKPNGTNLSGMRLLADEIGNRRLKTAKLLLNWGADPNTKDWHSQPVLILAIKDPKIPPEDKIDLVRHLFAKGAKADVVDGFNKTSAIRYAVEAGLSEIISLMLQHGAKTTDTMPNGDSLLKYAIDQGRKDLAEALLHYGADPNYTVGRNGVKPLVQALMRQDLDMIRLLREAGADVSASEIQDVARALAKSEIFDALGIEDRRDPPAPPPVEGDPPTYDTAMKD
ncbi:ankyrin repeat [Trichoderma arundinaceum]|uniref:Ankyrin repeat n=1 Tax=Trichoderma arundinaceum TaxID=490622 RepID=A0A395NXH4_TRIAR|nr:ankyrin repeat [Trichoderma arundinaceum]